jgi:Cu+-exporting ATPase
MEKDPVCGMAVDPATTEQTTQYQAKTYYFCTSVCRRAFQADPTEYVNPD